MTTALIIGRFQPFHSGHLRLVEEALKEADLLFIGIGSSRESHTKENPFTAKERRAMIEASVPDTGRVSIYEIPDIGDNERWVAHVESLVPAFDEVYTNGELERTLFAKAGYGVHATGLYNRYRFSGVEIRRRILAGEEWDDLVPEGTLKVLKEIDGVGRIRGLDKNV
ncbi:MAG: nicotinamide-nucleotide adenylyltransferase [Candidatus Altiarchaeota archaeon]|nr:nicotinamide-nucleotide adenylyltransferase [Candidatus Altiarchaeota archaeon]